MHTPTVDTEGGGDDCEVLEGALCRVHVLGRHRQALRRDYTLTVALNLYLMVLRLSKVFLAPE